MTQKDYVKERLALLKLLMTGIVGAMVAIAIQSSGIKFINGMAAIMVFGIFLVVLGRAYTKLLDELKDLP